MIDFCMFLDSRAFPWLGTLEAIESLCRILPAEVINHTDTYAPQTRPIAASIKIKRRGRAANTNLTHNAVEVLVIIGRKVGSSVSCCCF